jgi:hypothetical protein
MNPNLKNIQSSKNRSTLHYMGSSDKKKERKTPAAAAAAREAIITSMGTLCLLRP